MNVTYWTGFSKRKNSTKRPATTGTDAACVLKDDTSILFPDIDSATIPANANYMYISDFGRYYYVRDVTKVGASRNVFHLEVDPMGSFKSNIGSTSALIEFCSDSTNIFLSDPRNKPMETFWEKKTTLLNLASTNPAFNTSGKFILGIAGGAGGITHYVLSNTALQAFYNTVFSTNFFQQLTNDFYTIRDCIVSCRWVPYTPPLAGPLANIAIGGTTVTIPGEDIYAVSTRFTTFTDTSYNIAFPSDDLTLGTNYLDMPPFTSGTLYLPFVGIVPLDIDVVAMSKQIRIQMSIDNYTSDVIYKLSNDSGDYMATYTGKCGTDIPIVSQGYNAMGVLAGAIGLVGGIATAGLGAIAMGAGAAAAAGIGAGASAALTGSVGFANSLALHTQVNGSMSSGLSAQIGLAVVATVLTRHPTETNLTAYAASSGMPYYQVSTISSHSGYVQCYNASVSIPGLPQEKDTVNAYVNSGFYYE